MSGSTSLTSPAILELTLERERERELKRVRERDRERQRETERERAHLISTMVSGNFSCPVSGSISEASPAIIELTLKIKRGSSFAKLPGTTSPY